MNIMEIKDGDYTRLMGHIKDLRAICENLKLNVNLLEIPIEGKSLFAVEGSSESAVEDPSSDGSSEDGLI